MELRLTVNPLTGQLNRYFRKIWLNFGTLPVDEFVWTFVRPKTLHERPALCYDSYGSQPSVPLLLRPSQVATLALRKFPVAASPRPPFPIPPLYPCESADPVKEPRSGAQEQCKQGAGISR